MYPDETSLRAQTVMWGALVALVLSPQHNLLGGRVTAPTPQTYSVGGLAYCPCPTNAPYLTVGAFKLWWDIPSLVTWQIDGDKQHIRINQMPVDPQKLFYLRSIRSVIPQTIRQNYNIVNLKRKNMILSDVVILKSKSISDIHINTTTYQQIYEQQIGRPSDF